MGSAVKIRTDYSAAALRRLAKVAKDVNQSRRLLSLAAVMDGMSREDAARIGGMVRQTLRDWVHRFNEAGPDGLKDAWYGGPTPRLSPEAIDGVVRWRRIHLQRVIEDRFRRRLSRALRGQAAEGTRLLAHERAAAPRRRMPGSWKSSKKLPAHAKRPPRRSAEGQARRGVAAAHLTLFAV